MDAPARLTSVEQRLDGLPPELISLLQTIAANGPTPVDELPIADGALELAEREELLAWRDGGRLPDADLRVLERELDHEESLLPG